jgi:hypothetical protein
MSKQACDWVQASDAQETGSRTSHPTVVTAKPKHSNDGNIATILQRLDQLEARIDQLEAEKLDFKLQLEDLENEKARLEKRIEILEVAATETTARNGAEETTNNVEYKQPTNNNNNNNLLENLDMEMATEKETPAISRDSSVDSASPPAPPSPPTDADAAIHADSPAASLRSPDNNELKIVIQLCAQEEWAELLARVQQSPWMGRAQWNMTNNIATTLLHQAITGKGRGEERCKLIESILDLAPTAATLSNGFGSLPLHALCQRNVNMKSSSRSRLIVKLIRSYEGALLANGGPGQRTPLHAILTGTKRMSSSLRHFNWWICMPKGC